MNITEGKDKELTAIVGIIDDAIKNGMKLFDFGKILKSSGFKKTTTSMSPVAHIRIEGVGSKNILIFNKKYVDKGSKPTILGQYAIDREG